MGRVTSPSWHDDEFPAWTSAKQQVNPDALPVFASPWQGAVSRLTEPTLLICGEESRGGIATRAIVEEARALNPLLSAVQIQGAGHNIRRENFPDFLLAVRSFLDAD
jgi:pimeloyl-ACP methyl ester carboxylesterase